jgi:hypothetical protein
LDSTSLSPLAPGSPRARDEGKYEEIEASTREKSEEGEKNIDGIFSVPGYGEKFKFAGEKSFIYQDVGN